MQKVSVVFPVGPGVGEAGLALRDLLGQSWGDLEILAVLNGCLPEVREEFLGVKDERLRVIDHGEEGDLLKALNCAVEESRGKWLARMDTDDRCDSRRIEKTVGLLMEGDCEVASCGIELVNAQGEGMQRYVDWVNGLEDPAAVSRERFIESPVVQPTVMMAKETFLAAGGYDDDGLAEDYSLWLRLLGQGRKFGKVSDKLYQWHDRDGRLTRTHARYGQKEMLVLKAKALAEMTEIRARGVAICGAGPIGKVIARELIPRGITVHGFFEVSPKRIGSVCQGRLIVSDQELGKCWRDAVLLSAVGVAGGREMVGASAGRVGYVEGEDFWCCC